MLRAAGLGAGRVWVAVALLAGGCAGAGAEARVSRPVSSEVRDAYATLCEGVLSKVPEVRVQAALARANWVLDATLANALLEYTFATVKNDDISLLDASEPYFKFRTQDNLFHIVPSVDCTPGATCSGSFATWDSPAASAGASTSSRSFTGPTGASAVMICVSRLRAAQSRMASTPKVASTPIFVNRWAMCR